MKSVVIVDDDPNVIKGLLTHISWRALNIHVQGTANNGEEALDQIKLHPPDIVITDVYMPKMNGLQLIEILHQQFPSIEIIIHSAYDEFDNARLAMKLGVQHFFLKPCNIVEFETVIKEVVQEMEAEEKQKKLQQHYDKKTKAYISHARDAFLREMLITKYNPANVSAEKLEMLELSGDAEIIVASLSLIRSPYLTKSKEREWQLLKFGAGNIIKETVGGRETSEHADIYFVDYTDSTFVIIFFAKPHVDDLGRLCKRLTERMVENILGYMKLSLTVGIGKAKSGIHGIIDSYLESQQALEAGDYRAINQVFTYDEVSEYKEIEPCEYPLNTLKEIQNAIQEKDLEQVLELWRRFEHQLLMEKHLSMFITQNICISTISALMMGMHAQHRLKEDSQAMSELVAQIYTKRSTRELCEWMRDELKKWSKAMKEELTGKRSNKLIHDVKEYIKHRYDEEITLTEIADSLYVTSNYLSHLFKRVTGETFVNYLNSYRIERAKELLSEKHYMVYEVSEMVGYQNPTYFSQVFKSITGMSPSAFYKLNAPMSV